MVKVIVEFDYDAAQPDELTIKKGDIISDVKKMDGGWWEGVLDGKKGVFPDNFVKDYTPPPSKPGNKPKPPAVPSGGSPVPGGPGGGNMINELKDKIGPGIRVGPPPPGGKPFSKPKVMAAVIFCYEPQHPDELVLAEGDVVEVTKQEEEGWWEGIVNGRRGMFPSNFVKLIDTNGAGPPAPAPSSVHSGMSRPAAAQPPKEPKPTGEFVNARPVVTDAGMARPARPLPPPIDEPEKPQRSRNPRAKVVYSYHAQNEDELTLNEGQTLTVLDQNLEDAGWWRGELNGKVGVFPDNFVELLPQAKEPAPPPLPPTASKTRRAIPVPSEPEPDAEPPLPAKAAPPIHREPRDQKPVEAVPRMEEAKAPKSFTANRSVSPPVTAVDESVVSDLRSEIQALKKTMVSQETYNKLQQELSNTKDALEAFKKDTLKKLVDLMKEIDEERKQASQNQVELNRLRRLAEDQWLHK